MARVSQPPIEFLCPLTHNLLEHPVNTSLGHTYEYAAISRWLAEHSTDPVTNEHLKSKALSKNLVLRSLIQSWIAANPEVAARYSATNVIPPPPAAEAPEEEGAPPASLTNEANLGKIIAYKGARPKLSKAQLVATGVAPASVSTGALTYEFRRGPAGAASGAGATTYEIRWVDRAGASGAWCPVPVPGATAVFATPQGLAFYDPKEVDETRVSGGDAGAEEPGAFAAKPCKFNPCTRAGCGFAHAAACRFGVACRDKAACNQPHPDPSSVVPLGPAYPLNTECKFKTNCTGKGCHFAHPNGRLGRVDRVERPFFATHQPDLSPLPDGPAAVDVGPFPTGATAVAYQGEFIFFYTPYPGTWAKEHYKTVTVHRFDSKAQRYRALGSYSLEGHYCNAAVGSHRFFVLSWWPFEDEAMRAIWEAGRQRREQDKALSAKEKELAAVAKDAAKALEAKDAELARQAKELAQKKAEIRELQATTAQQAQLILAQQQQAAAEKAAAAKRQAREAAERAAREQQRTEQRADQRAQQRAQQAERLRAESEWRARRAEQQARSASYARSERLRFRDPIHVYALEPGKGGGDAADWVLVLDYHKGAHGLELLAPSSAAAGAGPDAAGTGPTAGSAQRLLVTENECVFEFDLLVPSDFHALGKLPVVPGRLCEGF
jgi:hypothetical protein